ncbi:helix-turn-helix transcriptional regulator [Methylotuvimicrobium sp. KM1]|uniref:helix-turn-helix transcriptional regulator n=1 Tax=Methylotuvimicrobium sp. KM1 TaxID=3377707 RepID=UPI00384E9040
MSKNIHDTLVYRLAQILVKLNQGERLDPKALADEFAVNMRTIQRDLNERFAYLPIEKTDGKYHLNPTYLGKLNTKDIDRFASLAGISGLFPSLADDFLRDIFDSRLQSALLVKGHHYENLAGKEELFRELERAIVARRQVSFEYEKQEGLKFFSSVSPYKLVNHKGIWYLAAYDSDKLKSFSLTKIKHLTTLTEHFVWDEALDNQIAEEDGIWLTEQKQEIVIQVRAEVADYFKRRRLIAHQVIEKELSDGGLIISTKVGHINQVLPIVRYWIPHLRIISPDGLQAELEKGLANYLGMTD